MRASHRNFDEDMPRQDDEGPSFKLGDEEFHCMACPPGGVLPRVMSAARFDDRGRRVFNAPDIAMFIEDVLCDEMLVPQAPADTVDGTGAEVALVEGVMVLQPVDDVERWKALMEDKKRPIPIERLGDIMLWLIEYYTDRPTAPPRR